MFLRSKPLYPLIFFPPQEGLKIINNYPMVSLITYKLSFIDGSSSEMVNSTELLSVFKLCDAFDSFCFAFFACVSYLLQMLSCQG